MDLIAVINTVLRQKYADFSGRASRSEYWYWTLAVVGVTFALEILALLLAAVSKPLGVVVLVALLLVSVGTIVPGLAVGVRRLHDTGRSGWFLLLGLVPLVGGLILLVFMALESAPGANKYGPKPETSGVLPSGSSRGPAAAEPGTLVLEAVDVTKRFGGLVAVNGVSLTVGAGEVVGLIGPNGAGKTTFFNCLTGMETPTAGSVSFMGSPLRGRPDLILKAGVARTFQNIRLFPNMTAVENVIVGRHARTKAGVLSAVGRGPRYRREERESDQRAKELLAFVGLGHVRNELAKSLPYGDQRRLEIARALATDPGLLLLDEPTAGMNANETAAAIELVRKIQGLGIAVVLIEHDMRFVFNLCDRVAVLVQGEKLLEGSPDQVQSDERVIAAYLGKPAEDGAAPSDKPSAKAGPSDKPSAKAGPSDKPSAKATPSDKPVKAPGKTSLSKKKETGE